MCTNATAGFSTLCLITVQHSQFATARFLWVIMSHCRSRWVTKSFNLIMISDVFQTRRATKSKVFSTYHVYVFQVCYHKHGFTLVNPNPTFEVVIELMYSLDWCHGHVRIIIMDLYVSLRTSKWFKRRDGFANIC